MRACIYIRNWIYSQGSLYVAMGEHLWHVIEVIFGYWCREKSCTVDKAMPLRAGEGNIVEAWEKKRKKEKKELVLEKEEEEKLGTEEELGGRS